VFRTTADGLQVLIVTAKRRPDEWVFPKGHIEADESAADAAVREVHEEAGVAAELLEPIEDVRIRPGGEEQVIRYFLMRAAGDASPGEGRRALWLAPREAERQLSFEEARGTLRRAGTAMARRNQS